MNKSHADIVKQYQHNGYAVVRQLFSNNELCAIEPVILKAHQAWIERNLQHYQSSAVNSAGLSHRDYLSADERLQLFQFIADTRLTQLLAAIVAAPIFFANTQLFFNPRNPQQKNYWHRDIQYGDFSLAQQQQILCEQTLLHFRLPLRDETGLQLIPGTHQRWDNEQEYHVRKGLNGCTVSDDLAAAETIVLQRGDILIFSAAMIHRGLYSADRLAFDICCGGYSPQFSTMTDMDYLPGPEQLKEIANNSVFGNAIKFASAN